MKRLCIINAPQDSKAADMLKRHLVLSIRSGLFELVDEVEQANIVALMMSNDMLIDERAYAMSEAAKRKYQAAGCRMMPILVEPMAQLPDHLAMLKALPETGKPVRGDEDWANIAGAFRAIAMKDAS